MNGSINYVMKEVLSCNSSSPRFPSLDSFTASSGKNTTHYYRGSRANQQLGAGSVVKKIWSSPYEQATP